MQRIASISTLLVALGLLVLVVALTSCAPDTSAPEFNSEIAQRDSADDHVVSDAADSDETDSGKTIAPVAFTDQACLDCHTDKARLQELAVEDESTEELSEGPG